MGGGAKASPSADGGVSRAPVPKRIKRLLREHAAAAHEEELRRALQPLAKAFERWRQGRVSSGELSELIHTFRQGPARDLFVRYNTRMHKSAVARAIATGVLDKATVPGELLEYLSRAIEYYETEVSEK